MSKRSAKHMEYKSEYHKRFVEIFRTLSEHYERRQVWSDFVTMSACAISNAVDKQNAKMREEDYMKRVKRYRKEDAEQIAEMFVLTVMALDQNQEQDFLGEIFGSLNLHNEWHGQFFTPYPIGSFMARVNLESISTETMQKDTVAVSDPCCGAGCLLIACANEAKRMHYNYQEKFVFVAQDVDPIAAMMCYIQLSLLGCKAIVKVGNSLTDPFTENEPMSEKIWLTPMFACGKMFRIISCITEMIEEDDGREETIPKNSDKESSNLEGEVSA